MSYENKANNSHSFAPKNVNFDFYKNSLKLADDEVKTHAPFKALKDIVGAAYENHRKRVWEYFGFEVSKDKNGAGFDVDWSITYNGVLTALEEDKGHYVDSCFLERALTGFCKTVNTYKKNKKIVPTLILCSFTRYKKFSEKLEDDMDTRKDEIKDEINKKLVYTTLSESDRLPRTKWFSKAEDRYDCYYNNVSDKLILKDIEFIQSLVPRS